MCNSFDPEAFELPPVCFLLLLRLFSQPDWVPCMCTEKADQKRSKNIVLSFNLLIHVAELILQCMYQGKILIHDCM